MKFLIFGILSVNSQRFPARPPAPAQHHYAMDTASHSRSADYFGESNWNDFAGLWIENNDYLVSYY